MTQKIVFKWLQIYSPVIFFLSFSFSFFLFFFLVTVFFWLWYHGDGGFIEWICKCSLLFNILVWFEKDKFFVCLVEFPSEAIWSWTLVCRDFFKLWILFHFYWLVCSNYLFLLDWILARCIYLETCPFLIVCPICWHITD